MWPFVGANERDTMGIEGEEDESAGSTVVSSDGDERFESSMELLKRHALMSRWEEIGKNYQQLTIHQLNG